MDSHSLSVGCTWWLISKEYEKGKKSTNFTVEKPDKQCLGKTIKTDRSFYQMYLFIKYLDKMWWKWHLTSTSTFRPPFPPPVWFWEKRQTNPNWGTCHEIPEQYSPKLSRSSNTRKVQKSVTAKSLRRHEK